MSEENLDAVRRGIEAYIAGDSEAWVAELDPEITWEETPGLGPDPAIYRGVDQVRAAVSSWLDMWVDYDFEVRRYIDAGGDDVVVLANERGRSRTGVSVERELGQIHTLRDRKLVRTRLYGSWAEARKAAGLSE
jgi:ketosteroid isomerase-like protein